MRWLLVLPIVCHLGKLGQHLFLGDTDMVEPSKSIVSRSKAGARLGTWVNMSIIHNSIRRGRTNVTNNNTRQGFMVL